MTPRIGIVGRCNVDLHDGRYSIIVSESLRRNIIKSGGNPFLILPPQDIIYRSSEPSKIERLTDLEKENLEYYLSLCDGIIMPGGKLAFEYDHFILDYAIKNNVPILGICLGMQIMVTHNHYGCLEKNETMIEHCKNDDDYVHNNLILENTKLKNILNEDVIKVNSLHNYHAKDISKYIINTISEDGLIEGIEYPFNDFNIGVQWHPERNLNDTNNKKVFEAFINACKSK